jgi:integrase
MAKGRPKHDPMKSVGKYVGVYYITGTNKATGKPEKIYYIKYTKNRKQVLEKAGRQNKDSMTPAKASIIRARRMQGIEPTRAEAREEREAKQNRMTINRLWEAYCQYKTDYKNKDKDQSRFDVHIKPRFGKKEVSEIVTLDVDRFRRDLLKKGLAPQTVKNAMELLRRVINFGFKRDLVPMKNIRFEMPRTDNVINETLTPEQLRSFWTVLDGEPLDPEAWILKIMLFTGRRTGEIGKLEWPDIDFDRQLMTLKDTKAGRTEIIPFSDRVRELFENVPRLHKKYVFPNQYGGKRQRVDYSARRMRDKAGLPKTIRPSYCLRHTFASLAASNDVPDRILKALMGHTQAEARKDITSRYAHLTQERLTAALDQMAGVIDGILEGKKDNIVEFKRTAGSLEVMVGKIPSVSVDLDDLTEGKV